jgi:hypothetical protein
MDAPLLSYADRRALNIARNAERMRAIGLTTICFADLGPTALAQKQKRLSVTSEVEPLVNLQLRRSGRTSGAECVFFACGDHADAAHAGPDYKHDAYEQPPPPLDRVRATSFKSNAHRLPLPATAGSSRSMNCDVEKLLEFYIGNPIVPRDGQVKRAVMELSSSSGVCPSFNRMSGITEWANCVFLFVNVGGSDYENLLYFSRESAPRVDDLVADDSGAACAVMTWFAQPRQDANTPVLLRLQRSDTDSIVVFFRVVGVSEYIFGGRLQCVLFDSCTA